MYHFKLGGRSRSAGMAAVLAASAALFFAPSARADEAISSFDLGSGTIITAGGWFGNLGWTFTPTANITVTGLGWWDHDHDGLVASHDVGIWTDGTMLLQGSDTVAGGVTGTLVGDFRYTAVGTSFNLLAGTTYVISGVNSGEDYTFGVTNLTMSPSVTFGENRWDPSLVASYSGLHDMGNDPGYFGPSFQFAPTGGASVPEPGSYAMGAGVAISALLAFRKRRTS